MKKATLYLSYYKDNKVFDIRDPVANRDGGRQFFYDLKQELALRGYDLSTQDINPSSESEFTIYHDMPYSKKIKFDKPKAFLLIMEPPVVKAPAWKRTNQDRFNRVFTYDDSLVDNKTHFKFNYCFAIPTTFPSATNRERFLVTIIGNKSSEHPFELYSKRLETILWYEANHPDKLDFYGSGWDRLQLLEPGLRGLLLRQRRSLRTLKGPVSVKLPVLSQHKFALCFENCGGVDGYISEKIFDVFFAGTVPVYLGAPNVQSHIPRECFIDYREFSSNEDMNNYLAGMSEPRRLEYVAAAQEFLGSQAADPFRSHMVSQSIVERIVEALP